MGTGGFHIDVPRSNAEVALNRAFVHVCTVFTRVGRRSDPLADYNDLSSGKNVSECSCSLGAANHMQVRACARADVFTGSAGEGYILNSCPLSFYTVDKTKPVESTGLVLSLVVMMIDRICFNMWFCLRQL